MGKLKLNPDPTFTAKVGIAQPGADQVDVEFTFKHRTRAELQKFIEASADRPDVETIMLMASGWELTDEWNKKNLGLLVENYITAPRSIFDTYVDELIKARAKN